MESYNDIKEIFKVLADINRIRIIEVLTKECQSVNEIAKKADISQPLASHHLKVLKDAGITRVERQGTFNYY
ncbi:metalloregulator ArsR/SmtB family transcription factor [Wukongibacter baidiensis]|uniref:ArsR/SmtB family transcription factor n=1 Tax=Wukongibacter baidiensis TaxID=1723361 RepID=UPI003D7FFD72